MMSGNHDNETTLRLLYYPPVIKDDDNKCEVIRGRCKYSQQRCNGNGIDLVPPRDVCDNGRKRSDSENDDNDDDSDEHHDNDDNRSKSSKSSKSSHSSSERELAVTRCGAHCKFIHLLAFNRIW